MARLRIRYTKSFIGYPQDQRDTVRSLGLVKLHREVVREDTPTVRGMVRAVRHLVTVEELPDEQPVGGQE
jgi:large subunit ribosomal protein L30